MIREWVLQVIYISEYLNRPKSDQWATPTDLLEKLEGEFGEMFDPCPINSKFNGLAIEWKDINFVNPPYSEWATWAEKCYIQQQRGKTSIFLIPSRTDTKAFHKYIWDETSNRPKPGIEIRFIKGRLKFGGAGPAPFPSMLVVFRGKK